MTDTTTATIGPDADSATAAAAAAAAAAADAEFDETQRRLKVRRKSLCLLHTAEKRSISAALFLFNVPF
jgi:hypothetical protein